MFPKQAVNLKWAANFDRIQFSRGPSKFESDKPSAFHRSIYPKIDLFKLPLPRRSFIILLFHVFWMKPICSGQNLLWCLTFHFFLSFLGEESFMTKTVRHVGMVLMNAVAANRLPTHFQSKAEPIGHDRPMVLVHQRRPKALI